MNCIFCEICNNKIPSYKIFEDDIVIAFLDINPDSNGHTLIIPKQHFNDLFELNEITLNHIMKISKQLSKLLKNKLGYDGISLIQNNGSVQEVKHYHLHLKPHYNNDIKINLEEIYKKIIE